VSQPTTNLKLRAEQPRDVPAIREVLLAAFGQCGEANLVDALRQSGGLTLSAVALRDDRLVGYIAFSPVVVERDGGGKQALALAPVAVRPDCQRQGIGATPIHWALAECKRMGHGLIIVLGHSEYYPRFGFVPARKFGIECPFSAPSEAFMVAELLPGALNGCRGTVRYRPEFQLA